MGFSYSESSQGITIQIQLPDHLGMLNPDIMVSSSLIDAKEHLSRIDSIFSLP